MKKQDAAFWALALSFVFGAALRWPPFLRVTTIGLSGWVLAQVIGRLVEVYTHE